LVSDAGFYHASASRLYGKGHACDRLIVVYGYAMEAFFGWYSGAQYELFMIKNRIWKVLLVVVLAPDLLYGISIQFLWFKRS